MQIIDNWAGVIWRNFPICAHGFVTLVVAIVFGGLMIAKIYDVAIMLGVLGSIISAFLGIIIHQDAIGDIIVKFIASGNKRYKNKYDNDKNN